MLDRLIDLVIDFIGLFQVYTFVDQFEECVVLRCGKYHRTVGPGLRWLLPFDFERFISVNIVPEPMHIDQQSVHTKDEYMVNFKMGLSFVVTNPKAYLVDHNDTEELLNLLAAGTAYDAVSTSLWRDCTAEGFVKNIQTKINRSAPKMGARVTMLKMIDFANGKADRLWLDGVSLDIGLDDE